MHTARINVQGALSGFGSTTTTVNTSSFVYQSVDEPPDEDLMAIIAPCDRPAPSRFTSPFALSHVVASSNGEIVNALNYGTSVLASLVVQVLIILSFVSAGRSSFFEIPRNSAIARDSSNRQR